MTVLDTLNFVAFKPLANNPTAVRRRKLIAKIDEQILFLSNKKDYAAIKQKRVTQGYHLP